MGNKISIKEHHRIVQSTVEANEKRHNQETARLEANHENRINDQKDTIKVLVAVIAILSVLVSVTKLVESFAFLAGVIGLIVALAMALGQLNKQGKDD